MVASSFRRFIVFTPLCLLSFVHLSVSLVVLVYSHRSRFSLPVLRIPPQQAPLSAPRKRRLTMTNGCNAPVHKRTARPQSYHSESYRLRNQPLIPNPAKTPTRAPAPAPSGPPRASACSPSQSRSRSTARGPTAQSRRARRPPRRPTCPSQSARRAARCRRGRRG